MTKCDLKCEVFSRVVGYMRPVQQWNKGKKEEWKDRVEFDQQTSCCSCYGNKGRPTHVLEKMTF